MYLAIKLCASFLSKGLAIFRKPRNTRRIVVEELGTLLALSFCDTMFCVVILIDQVGCVGVLAESLQNEAHN